MLPRQDKRSPGLPALLLSLIALSLFGNAAAAQPNAPQRAEVKRAVLNQSALRPGDKAMLAVEVEVKEGFHAQSHTPPPDQESVKFVLALDKVDGVTFGEPIYPKGHDEQYPYGKLNVYTGTFVVFVPVEAKADAKPGEIKLAGVAKYQACDDKACYPPAKAKFEGKTSVVPAGTEVKPNEPELFKDVPKESAAAAPTSNTPTTAPSTTSSAPPVVVDNATPKWSLPIALGVAFLAGILFNIVPCVLPVLPIKVLGFAEVAQHDRRKTLVLASVFGAGIVSVFAVLAVLILVLQKITWGQQFSNPYFAWGMVLILLLLSLWLFGILQVALPSGIYGLTARHDTYSGNFLLGILTAILSTPCTGPLFVPVMGWAALQSKVVGVGAMMMVGVGMAFPYVALSAFPEVARRFPRTGPWSELFKQILGFVLLGFTVFFAAGRFVHPAGQWWAAVPVMVMAALYLMARTVQLSKDARPVAISSVFAVLLVLAPVLVACRFSGFFDASEGSVGANGRTVAGVNWVPYSDSALEAARAANKIVLVKFTANWCLNCQTVELNVFHDADAITALRKHDVVTIKADLSDEHALGWSRLHELLGPSAGIPLTAIYAPGYDKPVQIDSVYTTSTLVKTLDQLDAATKAVAAR
jgi:thiol:disulfide interchange protein DsbD